MALQGLAGLEQAKTGYTHSSAATQGRQEPQVLHPSEPGKSISRNRLDAQETVIPGKVTHLLRKKELQGNL